MIQRKQSIYLLLVTILMSFLLVSRYAELTFNDGSILAFKSYSVSMHPATGDAVRYRGTIMLAFLIVLTGMLNFANIFFYTKRIMQIRLCIVSCLMLLAMLCIMYFYYNRAMNGLADIHHTIRLSGVFPIIGIILDFLAYRAIQQDEILVKSYNRLR